MNLVLEEFNLMVAPLPNGAKTVTELTMPKDAEVLGAFASNSFSVSILAAVKGEAPPETRSFTICAYRGAEIKWDEGHVPLRRRLVGTVVLGGYAFHVFEGRL